MDVKLSLSSSSPSSPSLTTSGKQFDFCDDLCEHGYGSLEDLHCPTSSNGSPMVQGCDLSSLSSSSSSSSLPTTITTTTITSSSPSLSPSSPPFSSSSSIDSITNLNNLSNLSKSTKIPEPSSTSHGNNCNSSLTTGDQNSDYKKLTNSPALVILGDNLDNLKDQSNRRCKETSSDESKSDEKITNDGKVHSPLPQMIQSGNRFRFVPKNRQSNDTKFKGTGTCPPNNRNNNYRGSRKHSRSESDCVNREHENRKRSQMRNKSNEDVVFIIRRVDRSLRRTVSESSGETLPVRGILKYPRDWDRRTLSESNCDNSEQSNLMDSHENGQTQSLECISSLEASCEASTESACSSAGESAVHDEEKPKKSVHFNRYVSKATFNINSTILNNNSKHSGSNKKKNRRQNSNNQSSNHNHNNDHKNISISTTNTTTTTTITTPTTTTTNNNNSDNKHKNHKNHKDHNNKHQNPTSRWKTQQSHQQQQHNHHLEPNNNQRKIDSTSKSSNDQQSVGENESIVINDGGDKLDQNENIDPMETKMRSRQDSGYDSETNERKGFVENSETTTCVKSPNRQFTVKKVDLN